MGFALGPKAQAAGYRIAAFHTIGSTSTEALERAKAGDPGRLWVVAKAQTAGHGRRGRAWQTPEGNLAASVLLRSTGAPAQIATLGFVAGLALEAAIQSCAPQAVVRTGFDGAWGDGARLRLKWPNDVLVDGAKVSGILLQAIPDAAGASCVVIGFGVNVLHAPADVPYPATSLADCGARTTSEELFQALSDAWVEQEIVWDGGRGFADIRRRWLERAHGLGAPVAVQVGADVLRGVFETIDADGMLVVKGADGLTRKIAAGEVHFGAVATAGR